MTTAAGLFLMLFGAAGAWFLAKHYPTARYLRASYAFMAIGGALFVAWGVSKAIVVGVAAAALLAIGGSVGVFGALRRELRLRTPER